MGGEEHAITILKILEDSVLSAQVANLQRTEVIPHALKVSNAVVEVLANGAEFFLTGVISLTLLVSLGIRSLELCQSILEFLHAVGEERVALLLQLLDFLTEFFFQLGHFAVASILIHRNDHVGREVDDLFEVLGCHVQEVTQTGRDALEVPNVSNGSRQLDVTHALAAHRGLGDLNATTLADDSLEANALVFSTRALPVTAGSKDLLTEEAILLRLERAVVDGLWLLDLTVGPTTDVV